MVGGIALFLLCFCLYYAVIWSNWSTRRCCVLINAVMYMSSCLLSFEKREGLIREPLLLLEEEEDEEEEEEETETGEEGGD
jgi:hypothetical protein